MKRKLLILAASTFLCLGALALVIVTGHDPLKSKSRKDWKENAVRAIQKQTSDITAVRKEIESLKTKPSVDSEWDKWISEDLILMANGDWIAYRNTCAKEEGRIPDLFIGHASDGKWYYSTYHFCIGMIVLKTMMDQPESLTKFRSDCYLLEFDGHSDECLKKTWPVKH